MSSLGNYDNVTRLAIDVTSSTSIAAAVKVVQAETGGALDCLVNNAGFLYVMPGVDIDLDEAKRVFDVNLWGALAMIKAFAPLLIRARGSVVNISSVLGCIGLPWTTSKAALHMASEILRMELMPLGVKVLTVNSGLVKTNLASNSPVLRLPAMSPYLSIEAEIAEKARMNEIKQFGIEPKVFAESIAKIVERGSGLDKLQRSGMSASANAEAINHDVGKELV
ncbi:MAG: hypothetical protein Q9218_002367 [Villophora microphyllina]